MFKQVCILRYISNFVGWMSCGFLFCRCANALTSSILWEQNAKQIRRYDILWRVFSITGELMINPSSLVVSILPLQTAESFRWQNISFWNVMTQSHMIIFHDKHYDNSNLRKTIYTLHAINRVHIFFHQMFIAICI